MSTSGDAAPSAAPDGELGVQVQIDNTPETHRRFATVDALEAVWDSEQEVVYYATGYDYSTGCPPAGTANGTNGIDISLTLARDGATCRTDLRRAVIVIEDVHVQPTTLTVAEDGETRTVPVTASRRSG